MINTLQVEKKYPCNKKLPVQLSNMTKTAINFDYLPIRIDLNNSIHALRSSTLLINDLMDKHNNNVDIWRKTWLNVKSK